MFNADFFPTPEPIIRKMLAPWLGKQKTVGRGYSRPTLASMTIYELGRTMSTNAS